MEAESNANSQQAAGGRKRTRMVRPYPIHTLEDALTIALAIQGSNAGLPFDRILLARSLGTTPASSGYTMKLNSSAKYGLTQGGYNDDRISLTVRGEAIVAPKGDDEYRTALVQAATQPDLFGQFYRMLEGKRLPEDAYAGNMLQRELGVRPDLTVECLAILKANGLYVGILTEHSDGLHVDLTAPAGPVLQSEGVTREAAYGAPADTYPQTTPGGGAPPGGRIFLGHSGDSEAVQLVKATLAEFGIPYGAAEGDDSDTQPVSSQVSEEMRNCTAAILVFAGDDKPHGKGRKTAGDKVLYQLGAASVLYGDRVVIFSEAGSKVTANVSVLSNVVFDRDRPEEAGLALIRGALQGGCDQGIGVSRGKARGVMDHIKGHQRYVKQAQMLQVALYITTIVRSSYRGF